MLKIILLFTVSIVASGSTSYFYKNITLASPAVAHSFLSASYWMAPAGLIFLGLSVLSGETAAPAGVLPVAAAGGICCAVAACMLFDSMRKGSYTIAVIIVNMNFCVPIIMSRLFLNERASLTQLLGILLAVAAIVIINIAERRKNSGEKTPRGSVSGTVSALIASAANGMLNYTVKLQQHNTPGQGRYLFFGTLYLTAAITCAATAAVIIKATKVKAAKGSFGGTAKLITPSLGLGLCVAVCYLTQSALSSSPGINASAQFTVTLAGSLMLSLIIGWVKYREKFDLISAVSIVICLLAIACQTVTF